MLMVFWQDKKKIRKAWKVSTMMSGIPWRYTKTAFPPLSITAYRMRRQDTSGELAQSPPRRSPPEAGDEGICKSRSEHNCCYPDAIEQSCMPTSSLSLSCPTVRNSTTDNYS